MLQDVSNPENTTAKVGLCPDADKPFKSVHCVTHLGL